MAAESADRVALLALLYRELYNARHTGPDSPLDDFENCLDDVGLLGMMGSQSLSELDWFVIQAMERPELLPALASDLTALDPIRAERCYTPGRCEFSELGVTMSRSDVDALARRSYAQATGQRVEDVLDEWGD